ncbi:MAG: DNA recombination protein RmuC [Actinobacteria bacterium]|nr:DNA recombination protein RmuC [Actinomycetota bacterium]NDC90397.1 DNA recombination protein RmuC [Acidimicrobiia bacterium]NDC99858.1 DNA recombination protein RmuC [bacterium]NBO97844.1 DNA recombination protein RmuC [Actinomycetota bacterium]NBP41657.1 DNA recombination protein RmuC [Actinomycetota bacterium]
MEILVGLLVVVIVSLGVLLFRQNNGGNISVTPQNFDQTALIDAVKTAVDAQVGKATQQALENVNSQIDRTYQARTQTLATETKSLLDPVATQMHELRNAVSSLQSNYTNTVGVTETISKQIDTLNQTTSALQSALKSTSARGAWGEQQLRNVIELAGMLPYCDFFEQTTVTGNDRTQRPDAVIKLPNDGCVVIDSKTPLDSYLKAQETSDATLRQQLLNEHAKALAGHAKVLADKKYWEQFDRSPEYVIMFIPGESFLADALRADGGLLEVAMRNRVLIASPVNLLALLLAVAKGWQAFQIAEHAESIAALGRELYERIDVVLENVEKTGRGLETAIGAYNRMVGSIESRMLATLRKFKDAGVTSSDLTEISNIDSAPRQLSAPELTKELDS